MKKDYETLIEITEVQEKQYLLEINHDLKLQQQICECMHHRQLQKLCQNDELYQQAIEALYQTKNYEDMEYHVMMINHLFHQQQFYLIKKDLFEKITQQRITLDEYCVIRHLIDMKHLHFEYIIHLLHDKYNVSHKECARICLLENQPHLAYMFLKQMDHCENEAMLDLLRSYSLRDYLSLMKCYRHKQKPLVFQSNY